MNKIILLIIVLRPLLAFTQNVSEVRTACFPKTEIIPHQLPNKENLWVFILAGQSNMAGRGIVEPPDTIPSDRILTLNKNGAIIIAKEPLHFYEPSLTGLDCGLSFGKELIKHIPDSIYLLLIPTAVGGSSISQWLGDSTFRNVRLFTNFTEKLNIGKNYGTLKGVLWLQGETDASNVSNIKLYKKRLSQLIIKFRKTGGNENLPVMIGELGSFSKNNNNWQKINRQIMHYVSSDRNASLVKTADLKANEDQIHFNSEGQRVLGQRFATAYIRNHK